MRAAIAFALLLEVGIGCGKAVVSLPDGSTAATSTSAGGAGGAFDPGGGNGAPEPQDAGADLVPCDATPPYYSGTKGFRSCCGGFLCRGECLDSEGGPLCDCGGVEGGCTDVFYCCKHNPEDPDTLLVCALPGCGGDTK